MLTLLCFVLLFLQIVASDNGCPTDYSYSSDFNKCIKFFDVPATQWDANMLYCKPSGGSLLSIHNSFENSFVFDLQQTIGVARSWIGATKPPGNNWIWFDGTNFNYMYGLLDIPSPDDQAKGAYIDLAERKWKVADWSMKLPFFCAATPTTPPNAKSKASAGSSINNLNRAIRVSSKIGV
ncbi:unnamed protein product, partial [Mesorhabditis belari]|uniref:C-type lectin domain-containing protein n=1 Tax=Mesorhabditis belari TaxID=2138241 RepID=A0AAF3EKR5_9BILA